jgi:hypothetical protein
MAYPSPDGLFLRNNRLARDIRLKLLPAFLYMINADKAQGKYGGGCGGYCSGCIFPILGAAADTAGMEDRA